MNTDTSADWTSHAQTLIERIRERHPQIAPEVLELFRRVPRHLFLPGYYHGGRHTIVDHQAGDYTDQLRQLAYDDSGRMTHLPGDPANRTSSNSQPSLVARLLDLVAAGGPVRRVLEIGAGTGYLATLCAVLTGAQVTTLDASEIIAHEARAAVERSGHAQQVRVIVGDGYAGHEASGPYDLIIATCGVAGIPPTWIDQLAPGGRIITPLAHGGAHPLALITNHDGAIRVGLRIWADFMPSTGPLYGGRPHPPISRQVRFAEATTRLPGVVPADLDLATTYTDMWTHLAAHDARVTAAVLPCANPEHGACALVDEPPHGEPSIALIQPGHILASGPDGASLAYRAETLARRWEQQARPGIAAWQAPMTLTGDATPLYTPTDWTHHRPANP